MFPLCAAYKTCAAWSEALHPVAVCGLSDKAANSENKQLENGVGARRLADKVWGGGCMEGGVSQQLLQRPLESPADGIRPRFSGRENKPALMVASLGVNEMKSKPSAQHTAGTGCATAVRPAHSPALPQAIDLSHPIAACSAAPVRADSL